MSKEKQNDMARYIDAEALLEELRSLQVTITGIRVGKSYLSTIVREYQKSVLKIVHEQPTADVVTKSEADDWYQLYHSIKEELKQEKMYHRETENLCDRYCIESQQAKKQLALEILSDLKKEVHNKATFTHAKDTYSFINLNTFDQIINEMIRRCEKHGNQEA